jgi:hypothetical protein
MELPVLDRRVMPTAGPVGRVATQTPAAGFDSVSRGLDISSRQVLQVQQLDQAKADRAQLSGLEAELTGWETKALYDPNTGAYSKKGQDALALGQQYLPEFDKQAGELAKNIQSPKVKAAYDELVMDRRANVERNLGRYSGEQKDVYQNSQRVAQLSAMDDAVAANPTDQSTIDNAIERKRWTVNDAMDARGASTEERKAAIHASDSAVHRQAITGLVNSGLPQVRYDCC